MSSSSDVLRPRGRSGWSKDQIRDDYLREREAYASLVGTFWPAVAYERVMALRAEYVEGTSSYWGDLPPTPPPRSSDGSVGSFLFVPRGSDEERRELDRAAAAGDAAALVALNVLLFGEDS